MTADEAVALVREHCEQRGHRLVDPVAVFAPKEEIPYEDCDMWFVSESGPRVPGVESREPFHVVYVSTGKVEWTADRARIRTGGCVSGRRRFERPDCTWNRPSSC